jgi:hypothetical protein
VVRGRVTLATLLDVAAFVAAAVRAAPALAPAD